MSTVGSKIMLDLPREPMLNHKCLELDHGQIGLPSESIILKCAKASQTRVANETHKIPNQAINLTKTTQGTHIKP